MSSLMHFLQRLMRKPQGCTCKELDAMRRTWQNLLKGDATLWRRLRRKRPRGGSKGARAGRRLGADQVGLPLEMRLLSYSLFTHHTLPGKQGKVRGIDRRGEQRGKGDGEGEEREQQGGT
jgi:hypothetical protein